MSNAPLTMVRNRIGSLTRIARTHLPLPAALASVSFVACERLGARVSGSRTGRLSLLGLIALFVMVGPAAAQEDGGGGGASCGSGPLTFLSDIYSLITTSAGLIIVSMVIVAGVLKMIPMRGTNSWGNALVGSVIVGIVFLVLGPAVVNLADQSTGAVDMSVQCTGNGSGSGSGG